MAQKTVSLNSKETAVWLKEHNDFLILTHRRPDGDTLGSAAALCCGLRAIGKRAYILGNPETTERYLEYVTPYLAPPDFSPATVIAVDTADPNILAVNAGPLAQRVDLDIDHHASNKGYAKYSCLDASLSSCGELVYEILMALKGEVSAEEALPLYVALTTDTGCFQYANVTANTLEVGSRLIAAGADYRMVNKTLFRTKSRSRMRLDGALYSSLQYHHEGRTAIGIVTLDLMAKTGVTEDDLDDIATIPNQAKGVKIGIIVRELKKDSCKVSVRTSPDIDANLICKTFGGGGHSMAAGCLVDADPETVAHSLVAAAKEALR